jgi:hypothetical protein
MPGIAAMLTRFVATFTKTEPSAIQRPIPALAEKLLAHMQRDFGQPVPDLHIELLNAGEIEPVVVAHHWLVKRTNTGKGADGSEPTGRAIAFKGGSIIQVEGDKVVSDQCYSIG